MSPFWEAAETTGLLGWKIGEGVGLNKVSSWGQKSSLTFLDSQIQTILAVFQNAVYIGYSFECLGGLGWGS